jgi:hypothetical protein
MGFGANWGTTPEERSRVLPCDVMCGRSDAAYFRAVSVDADAGVVFRWLC